MQSRTGPWTDVHALGLLFVEMVTGKPPYGRSGNPRYDVIDTERPSAGAWGVDVGALEPVIAKAVALRPTDRHADAGELLEAARLAMRAALPATLGSWTRGPGAHHAPRRSGRPRIAPAPRCRTRRIP
jgi:serine/threonine-protein kinase